MGENITNFPIHVMIKPESLEHEYFADYIRTEISVLEQEHGQHHKVLRTTLTPDEVALIYAPGTVPKELVHDLTTSPTEHYFIQGDYDIYEAAKKMKGKHGLPGAIRGELEKVAEGMGIQMERWQNFVHTADTLDETIGICSHFAHGSDICTSCVASGTCT